MKSFIAAILVLSAYTLIYTGISKYWPAITAGYVGD